MKYESDNNVNVLESENDGILSNFDQIAHLRVTMSIGHYMHRVPWKWNGHLLYTFRLLAPPLTGVLCFTSLFFEAFPWWGVSIEPPWPLKSFFFKWIRNKIISFSYCKVKVINDYLTLLVKQYSLKSSNTLVKKVSLYSVHWQCNKNNHIPL